MDSFRNGYIAGFITAILCIVLAAALTQMSNGINNYQNKIETK
jgi:hypothetical protein